jgi:hypothetical protein
MRVKLTEVRPTRLGNGVYHYLEVELPSGRVVMIYTNTEDDGQLPDGMSEIDLEEKNGDYGPIWYEPVHPLPLNEYVALRDVMES